MQHRLGNRPIPPSPLPLEYRYKRTSSVRLGLNRLIENYLQLISKTYGTGIVLIFLGSPVVILHAMIWLVVHATIIDDLEIIPIPAPPLPDTPIPLPPDLLWVRR